MYFTEKMKRLRKRKGLTHEELAAAVGLTRRSIVSIEHGERTPSDEFLGKISGLFGVTPDFLMDERQAVEYTREELFLQKMEQEGGTAGKSQAKRFLDNTRTLFAGGTMSDEDKAVLFDVLTEIYNEATDIAKKKYGRPGRPRKNKETGQSAGSAET